MDDEARYFPFFHKRIGGELRGPGGYRDGSFLLDLETLKRLYPDQVPSSTPLGNIAIGPYKGGASMEEIGAYRGGAEVVPMRMAAVPYTLPMQRTPYVINRNVHWMDSPIKRDYTERELMNLMNRRYGV